jgi:hypothetical protein
MFCAGGSEQALAGDGEEAWEAGVAVTAELLGVSEGAFDGLFPALVDALAPRVSRWTSTRSRISAQTWPMISRVALRLDVYEASNGQLLQSVASLLYWR